MGFTKVATQASENNTLASVVLAPGVTRTRNTYTFAGWCLGSTDHSQISVNDMVTFSNNSYHDTATVCDGTIYATGASMPIDPTIDNTDINLYAVWTPTTFDQAYAAAGKSKVAHGSNSYYKMQDMTSTICNSVSPNQTTILVDYRKNTVNATTTIDNVGTDYHVGKLEDGKCWLLDNLDLNLNNSTVVGALKGTNESGTNTNANVASITALKNGGGSDSNGRAQTGLSYSNWSSGSTYLQGLANRSGTCSTTVTGNECTYSGSYNNATVVSSKTGIATQGVGYGKIGTFYNYCAASAGSYCYSNSYTGTNNDVYDICPSNWKLPIGGSGQGSVAYLSNAIAKISTTPKDSTKPISFQGMLSMPLSGGYTDNASFRQGSRGYFWTSWRATNDSIYDLTMTSSGAGGSGYSARSTGRSVRCIAQ